MDTSHDQGIVACELPLPAEELDPAYAAVGKWAERADQDRVGGRIDDAVHRGSKADELRWLRVYEEHAVLDPVSVRLDDLTQMGRRADRGPAAIVPHWACSHPCSHSKIK